MFADAIDALEKLGALIRDAAQLPKRRRKQYLEAVTEAFSLLQAALVMVETKLGDLLHIQDDWELSDDQKRRRFVQELANLDNTEQWLRMEREVALCRSLKIVSRDLTGAVQGLFDRVALKDAQAIDHLISDILERERLVAEHISTSLERLAATAPAARESPQGRVSAWKAVKRQQELLRRERRQLIDAERSFLASL